MEKKFPNRILYSQEIASMEYNPAVVEGFKEDKSLYEESFQEYISKEEHDAIVQTLVEALEWYEKASCAERCADGNRANKTLEKFKERTG